MFQSWLLIFTLLFYSRICAEKCVTPDKQEGDCISLFSCSKLLAAVNAKQPSAVELVKQSNCGGDALDPLVCCGPSSNYTQTKYDENVSQTKEDKMSLLPSTTYCGYQHSDDYPSDNNFTARITEFPWLAGILFKNITTGVIDQTPLNVGSLINKRYVLTVAHCFTNTKIKAELVILGEYNTEDHKDCVQEKGFEECSEPVQVYGIEKAIIHPLYQRRAGNPHDIGLIRLNATISHYNDYIRPICLPFPGTKAPQPGDILQSSGWGNTVRNGKQVNIKKKVISTLITNKQCGEYYNRYNIHENHICISSTNILCAGDGGGPMMYSPEKFQWYLEGIVCFVGSGECGTSAPQGGTRVRNYLEWILENIEQ